MKKLLLLITGLLLLFSVEGQILRYANYTAPTPPEEPSGEHISNGTFDNADDWSVGAYWNISGGVATFTPTSQSGLSQADANMLISIEPNTSYVLTVDLVKVGGDGTQAYWWIGSSDLGINYGIENVYYEMGIGVEITFTTPSNIGNGGFTIYARTTGSCSYYIDNLSLVLDV